MYTYLCVSLMIISICTVHAGDDGARQRNKEAFWDVHRLHAMYRVPGSINGCVDEAIRESEIKKRAEEILRQATPTNDIARDISAFILSDMNKEKPK